jgi:hypothetical protein
MVWLRSRYGNVRYLDAGPGRKFRLVRVDETSGPAAIVVRVLDADGSSQNGQPVANHWPDDSLPDLRGGGLQTLWQPRALVQKTEGGHTGFGMGTGSYIGNLIEGGPHTLWVLSPSLPSDGLAGVGMLGGTNHDGPLSMVFQIGEDVPVFNSLPQALLWGGEQAQTMQLNPDAALQKRIFADGFVPNSPEFDVTFQGFDFVAQRAERLDTGAVRVYYCEVDDWANVRHVVRP